MHLVIATREDPHLPLARLSARGQLTELRATDLRFTPSEAAEFLKGVMDLSLSADRVAKATNRAGVPPVQVGQRPTWGSCVTPRQVTQTHNPSRSVITKEDMICSRARLVGKTVLPEATRRAMSLCGVFLERRVRPPVWCPRDQLEGARCRRTRRPIYFRP